MVKVFLDLETSGLSKYKHGVWQLACIVFKENKRVNEFERKFTILDDKESDPEAFKNAEITIEELAELPEPNKAFGEFKSLLEVYINPYNSDQKAHMYAYNARFDEKFLRQWFYDMGDRYFGSWFWFPPVDVMNLAVEHIGEERYLLDNFKQGTVAEYLGIEVEKERLHDALYDIELTKKIYDKLT